MPTFKFKGLDSQGTLVTGTEFANSQQEIAGRLMAKGLSILELNEVRKSPLELEFFTKIFQRVSRKELKFFYVNLATLINSGCTLRASITALAEQTENQFFGKALLKINSDIASGSSFSDAVSRHPKIFSQLFIHLVKAGEEGGMLDDILLRYAAYEENQEKIRSRVRGALVLPAIMVMVAIGVVVALLTYVFPKFMELFKGREQLLPLPTKIVMGVSNFLRNQWYLAIILTISSAVIIYLVLQTKIGYRYFSRLQLWAPLFGELFRKTFVSRFARTLAALSKGGVPTLRALKIVMDIIPNVSVKNAVNEIYINVEKGGNYSDPMQKNKALFPSMVTLMMRVGETTGNIDHMLNKISDYYDAEVEAVVAAIIATIEPIMTVIMGGVVLIISLSMFLPLFDIGKLLK
ncbi:type II secretion system F family protein [bacterium]|nr:type II secretion system F family protein [bacterium]